MSERPERHRAEPSGPTGRTWLVLVLLGLSGQIAWNVENSWFNTFVYDEVTPDPRPIAVMVAVSVMVAVMSCPCNDRISLGRDQNKLIIYCISLAFCIHSSILCLSFGFPFATMRRVFFWR